MREIEKERIMSDEFGDIFLLLKAFHDVTLEGVNFISKQADYSWALLSRRGVTVTKLWLRSLRIIHVHVGKACGW